MLRDDNMRQKFSRQGKIVVREKFSWEKIVEKVEGIYREVHMGKKLSCPFGWEA